MSALVEMRVSDIMEQWQPDRHPRSEPWSWPEAAEHAWLNNTARTMTIAWAFHTRGRHFADEAAPIMVGVSGFVIDGHHRIIVAHALMIPILRVAR